MNSNLHKKIGRKFKRGEYIFQIGDAGSAMFLITEGKVSIKRKSGGKEVVLSEAGAGEIIGEMSIIDNRPRSADAHCLADTSVLEISSYVFNKYIQENPGIVMKILNKFSVRLREMNAKLLEANNTIEKLRAQLDESASNSEAIESELEKSESS
ncbi:MAG: cyclic nucleotide-binding domain-containing protein [candidate division Zixibacteria bacterium]|nr:cyclic nucleotide-binding domain-containing protein [candidate division Zixibacteria bacterium]